MSTKTNNHIIWSNYNLDLKDWIEDIKERLDECGVDYSDWDEDMFYQKMVEVNDLYLDDERCNLNIPTEGKIIIIAKLGLWNCSPNAYKLVPDNSHNISSCLCFEKDCDYAEWWVDSHNNLRSRQSHHDGTHQLLYREFKPNLSVKQQDNFCNKILQQKVTSKDITKYTCSIGKHVRNVYGW